MQSLTVRVIRNNGIETIARHTPGGRNPEITITNVGVIVVYPGSPKTSGLIPWHKVESVEYYDSNEIRIDHTDEHWSV